MFNNRFNSTKKDPLVEAVQSAMQDGEIRRQAVAYVNEAFGVYNRNAVVREDLAEYDAAIEEAYNCMKEGEKKDEKKEDKPKADYSKMREKMVGKGKDLETTRKIVGEAKKLADKDYDKDGKIESPKDEVWGSRFRAAKMAGKMEEDEQIDEATGLKKVVHKVFGKQIAKHRANKADSEMERTLNTRGSEKKWAKNYDARERYGRIAAGKPPFKDMDEETQIDEVSKKTLGSYIKKAASKKPYTSIHGAAYDAASGDPKARKTIQKREKGIERATDRLTREETQIDEISKALALKAMKKSDERGEEEYDRDMTDDRLSDPKTHWDRAKRLRGHMKRKFGNKTIKTGGTDNLSSKSYEQGGGERRRADKLKKGPRAGMISARHRDKLKDNIKYSLGKHKKPNLPEETQIDEISVGKAYSYAGKKMEKERKGLLPGDRNPTSKTELKNMTNAANRTDKDYYKKRGFKKMEEGTAEAETSMNVTRDNRPSTPAQTNAATSGPSAADRAALASKISTMKEALKGRQHEIDANKNKRIDAGDFKLLRARKSMKEEQSFNAALLELAGKPVAGRVPLPPKRMVGKVSYGQTRPLPVPSTGAVPNAATTPAAAPATRTTTPAAAAPAGAKPSGYDDIVRNAVNPGAARTAMDTRIAASAARASGTTTPAAPTTTPAAVKPAPTPVKTVQTKGGAYPVFSKGSEAATGFKAAFDKAYAEKPGGTFKWKAAGETGPEREYKAVKAAEKPEPATPSAAPASTGTNASNVDRPTQNPSTQYRMPDNMTGQSNQTSGRDEGAAENERRRAAAEKNQPLPESVQIGPNKYRII